MSDYLYEFQFKAQCITNDVLHLPPPLFRQRRLTPAEWNTLLTIIINNF